MKSLFKIKGKIYFIYFIFFSIQLFAYSDDEDNVNFLKFVKYQSYELANGYNYFYLDTNDFKNEDYFYFKVKLQNGYFNTEYMLYQNFSKLPDEPYAFQIVNFCSEDKGDYHEAGNTGYYDSYTYYFQIPKPKDNYIIVHPPGCTTLEDSGKVVIYNTYHECSGKIPENYYLDGFSGDYYECYYTCKKCSEPGTSTNQNCDKCINNYNFLNDPIVKENNCLEICQNYYYFVNNYENSYSCTSDDYCPENYKLIASKKKCIKKCSDDDTYIFEYNDICVEKCSSSLKTDNEDKKCLESCPTNKFEYENTCLTNCPSNTYKIYIDRII